MCYSVVTWYLPYLPAVFPPQDCILDNHTMDHTKTSKNTRTVSKNAKDGPTEVNLPLRCRGTHEQATVSLEDYFRVRIINGTETGLRRTVECKLLDASVSSSATQ